PEWCQYNMTTQTASQSDDPFLKGTYYSFNAFRIPWRIGLDYQWFKSKEALKYLESLSCLNEEWEENEHLLFGYQHHGEPWDNYESAVAYGANIAYFSITTPDIAEQIYKEKLLAKLYEQNLTSYWEDPENYYTQNWAWFGTAFHTKNLPNLWKLPKSRVH